MPMFAAFIVLAALQQPAPAEKLDAYFKDLVAKKRSPSYAVCILKDGKVAYAKGYGWANLEHEVPATEHTVYRIGSLTKQFTATMIMQLVNEKKITLDEPAIKYLTKLPKSWSKVTIRQLLSHTSGVKSYTELPEFMAEYSYKSVKPEGILAVVEAAPLDFEPGSKWHYSNTGYEVLGMIIEKFDGRKFAASLKARILDPLGMTETYFTSEKDVVLRRAEGYSVKNGGFTHAGYLNMDWPYAAGSMESTVSDLAKWDAALGTEKLLPKASWDQLWTPTKLTSGAATTYGLGWGVGKLGSEPMIGHTGGINGFSTVMNRIPSKALSIIVLCNSEAADPSAAAIEATYLFDPTLRPVVVKVEDKEPAKTAAAKVAFEDLMAGKVDRTKFTPQMNGIMTDEMVKAGKDQLTKFGKLESFEFIGEKTESELKLRLYQAMVGTTVVKMDVALAPDGKIAMLKLHP